MTPDTNIRSYAPPCLRPLGSVHDLTQAGLTGDSSDGVLLLKKPSVVNGS